MDIGELNRYLTKLTSSEEQYRAGTRRFDWGSSHATTIVDGRPVLNLTSAMRDPDGKPHDTKPDLAIAPLAGKLSLRRNSRFNPVPEHVHDYIEMSYVYAGTCEQTVNGQRVTLKEDQVLLLDTNCPHAIAELGERDIMLSIVIGKDFLRENLAASLAPESLLAGFLLNALTEQTDHRRYVRFHSQNNRRVRLFFQELLCEYLDPSVNADEIALRLFQLILCELMTVYERDCTQRADVSQHTSVIPIIRYIEQNFLTCTQESVAERFFISPNYVSLLLKKHTGMNYMQMVQAQRLGRAASLLRTSNLPVTQVAREVGYANMSFFYRKFEQLYGCAPATYRARHAEGIR